VLLKIIRMTDKMNNLYTYSEIEKKFFVFYPSMTRGTVEYSVEPSKVDNELLVLFNDLYELTEFLHTLDENKFDLSDIVLYIPSTINYNLYAIRLKELLLKR